MTQTDLRQKLRSLDLQIESLSEQMKKDNDRLGELLQTRMKYMKEAFEPLRGKKL